MSTESTTPCQLLVLGGGPGGYPAAFRAADLGLQVTIVDMQENPGGVCLYRGCIPSKALLHVAALMAETEESEVMGLSFKRPTVDLDRMRAWKESVVERLTGGLGKLAKLRKVTYVRGRGRFVDAHTVEVDLHEGGTQRISFEQAVIATGSRPATIPFFPKSERILDSTGALNLPGIPKKMLAVGGGYIGLELSTVYAALGAKVDVVEMMPGLLPGADRDLVAVLKKRLMGRLENLYLETKVTGVEEQKTGIKVSFEKKDGSSFNERYDALLVSVGRKPNSEDLGLEAIGVVVNDRGFIEVNPQRRTTVPHLFAIGDVAGDPMLAHKATHEGIVAAEAAAGKKRVFEPLAIPAVVFTDPEIAWVGLTEGQAKEQGLNYKVAKFPWAASGKAITLERTDGMTKLIVDTDTERILGMAIVGVHAGDMIAEGTLAIEMGATVEDLALTIHPHPTLSETVMEAADVFFGHSAHFFQKR